MPGARDGCENDGSLLPGVWPTPPDAIASQAAAAANHTPFFFFIRTATLPADRLHTIGACYSAIVAYRMGPAKAMWGSQSWLQPATAAPEDPRTPRRSRLRGGSGQDCRPTWLPPGASERSLGRSPGRDTRGARAPRPQC